MSHGGAGGKGGKGGKDGKSAEGAGLRRRHGVFTSASPAQSWGRRISALNMVILAVNTHTHT